MHNIAFLVLAGVLLIALIVFLMWFFNKDRRYDVEYNKGIELYQQNNLEDALITFHAATRINPDKPDAFYNLGLVYMAMEKNDASEKNFLKSTFRRQCRYLILILRYHRCRLRL